MNASDPGPAPVARTAAWPGPLWTLALLLAALASLGPFAVDTYLPAFDGMASDLPATPVQLQQTLSVYLLGFAVMNLFHGALSDSLGRRPLVLAGTAVFSLASVGCALAPNIETLLVFRALQGLSAGAGMVVSRAIVRDLFPPIPAQRVMSQITLFFGLAPAIAPLVGGLLYSQWGWTSVFWFLAAITALIGLVNWRWLPETLPPAQRHPLSVGSLMRGYAELLRRPVFMALVVASGVPFNGFFLYVLSAPAFLGDLLGLAPTQYFLFFLVTIAGIMGGAALSGRQAGRWTPARQVHIGFAIMAAAATVNLALHLAFGAHPVRSMLPVGVFSFGWSLMAPAVTLMALDQVPSRRGTASSLQSCIGSLGNALVAGVIAPWVMHSAVGLAVASLALLTVGALGWWVAQRRVGSGVPDAGP